MCVSEMRGPTRYGDTPRAWVAWSTLLRLALRLDMPCGCSSTSVPRAFAACITTPQLRGQLNARRRYKTASRQQIASRCARQSSSLLLCRPGTHPLELGGSWQHFAGCPRPRRPRAPRPLRRHCRPLRVLEQRKVGAQSGVPHGGYGRKSCHVALAAAPAAHLVGGDARRAACAHAAPWTGVLGVAGLAHRTLPSLAWRHAQRWLRLGVCGAAVWGRPRRGARVSRLVRRHGEETDSTREGPPVSNSTSQVKKVALRRRHRRRRRGEGRRHRRGRHVQEAALLHVILRAEQAVLWCWRRRRRRRKRRWRRGRCCHVQQAVLRALIAATKQADLRRK